MPDSKRQLFDVLVNAIRAAPDRPALDVAWEAATATGLRRAVWHSLSAQKQDDLIIRAMRKAQRVEK